MDTEKIKSILHEFNREMNHGSHFLNPIERRAVKTKYTNEITSLFSTYQEELIQKIEKMKYNTPDNHLEQWAQREKMGYNQALNDIKAFITPHEHKDI